jgi:hypothetical protein
MEPKSRAERPPRTWSREGWPSVLPLVPSVLATSWHRRLLSMPEGHRRQRHVAAPDRAAPVPKTRTRRRVHTTRASSASECPPPRLCIRSRPVSLHRRTADGQRTSVYGVGRKCPWPMPARSQRRRDLGCRLCLATTEWPQGSRRPSTLPSGVVDRHAQPWAASLENA